MSQTRRTLKRTRERYWFHVTQRNYPYYITWHPRSDGDNRIDDEPSLPRICVGPTVLHCICAVPISCYLPIYIYRTEIPKRAYWPYQVADAGITREKWLRGKTSFLRVDELNTSISQEISYWSSMCPIGNGDKKSLNFQRQLRIQVKRILERYRAKTEGSTIYY